MFRVIVCLSGAEGRRLILGFSPLQGAGHNDVELYSQYLERLKQFVSVELLNWQLLPPGEESEHNATSTVSSATTSSVTEKLL